VHPHSPLIWGKLFFSAYKIWYGIYSILFNVLSARGASQLNAEKYPSNLMRIMPTKGVERPEEPPSKGAPLFIWYRENVEASGYLLTDAFFVEAY